MSKVYNLVGQPMYNHFPAEKFNNGSTFILKKSHDRFNEYFPLLISNKQYNNCRYERLSRFHKA